MIIRSKQNEFFSIEIGEASFSWTKQGGDRFRGPSIVPDPFDESENPQQINFFDFVEKHRHEFTR